MAKRRTTPKFSPKGLKAARAIAGEAFGALGKFSKAKALRRAEIERTTKSVLAEFVRLTYVPNAGAGEPWGRGEVQSIVNRTTVGVVAHRVARKAFLQRYTLTETKTGEIRWFRAGKRVSRANVDRAAGMMAYWARVRILQKATAWNSKRAREALRAMDDLEMWKDRSESPKVLPGKG